MARHYHSIELANREHAVLAMGYLYKAATSSGLIKGAWADMDFVISSQNREGKFLLDSSNGLLAFARHYSLALGYEAKTRTQKPGAAAKKSAKPRAMVKLTMRPVKEQLEVDKSKTESLSAMDA